MSCYHPKGHVLDGSTWPTWITRSRCFWLHFWWSQLCCVSNVWRACLVGSNHISCYFRHSYLTSLVLIYFVERCFRSFVSDKKLSNRKLSLIWSVYYIRWQLLSPKTCKLHCISQRNSFQFEEYIRFLLANFFTYALLKASKMFKLKLDYATLSVSLM